MLIYFLIHVLCALAAWYLVTSSAPVTDLSVTPFYGCLAAVLCFVFGPLALLIVLLLMLCQRG